MNDEPVKFYENKYYMFSNFSAFLVTYNGRVWMTSEHAYQAAKFDDPSIIDLIYSAPSAYDAKKVARSHTNKVRPNWKGIKVAVMNAIIREKTAQHSYVRDKLLETGDREIIENSPEDSFWGTGRDGTGKNTLGKIWMEVRGEIKKGQTI